MGQIYGQSEELLLVLSENWNLMAATFSVESKVPAVRLAAG